MNGEVTVSPRMPVRPEAHAHARRYSDLGHTTGKASKKSGRKERKRKERKEERKEEPKPAESR